MRRNLFEGPFLSRSHRDGGGCTGDDVASAVAVDGACRRACRQAAIAACRLLAQCVPRVARHVAALTCGNVPRRLGARTSTVRSICGLGEAAQWARTNALTRYANGVAGTVIAIVALSSVIEVSLRRANASCGGTDASPLAWRRRCVTHGAVLAARQGYGCARHPLLAIPILTGGALARVPAACGAV